MPLLEELLLEDELLEDELLDGKPEEELDEELELDDELLDELEPPGSLVLPPQATKADANIPINTMCR